MEHKYQIGDLVIVPTLPFKSWNKKKYGRIIEIIDEGYKIAESDKLYGYFELKPIKVDGMEDSEIYVDCRSIAASFVRDDEEFPCHTVDKSYYLERLDEFAVENNQRVGDIIKSKGFNYIHQIQQYLRNHPECGDLVLKY